jgi:hypothetical protein
MMIEATCDRCQDTIVEVAEQIPEGMYRAGEIDVLELGTRVDTMIMSADDSEGGKIERLMIRHAFGVDGKRCNGWGWVTRSWE